MPAPVVFPFEPNGGETIVEWYGYLTDLVGPTHQGREQRIQLRRHPSGAIETAFFSENRFDFQRMSALLYRKHAQLWAVPLWPYATRLSADAAIGATSLSVATAYLPFTDPLGLGPYALLWSGTKTFELISLNAIYPSSIELVVPLASNWAAASSYLIPVRTALLDQVVPLQWQKPDCVIGRHHFTFEAHEIGNIVPTFDTDELESVLAPI